jgi:hypothetical protein
MAQSHFQVITHGNRSATLASVSYAQHLDTVALASPNIYGWTTTRAKRCWKIVAERQRVFLCFIDQRALTFFPRVNRESSKCSNRTLSLGTSRD